MAAVGSAVGLGNVWRFPATAYANGGGAFFIPYIVALITTGIPLMILEYGVGQMFQGSAPKALGRVNKTFEWVGWFALGTASIISFYYAAVMAWSWHFLVASFRYAFADALPWAGGPETYFNQNVLNVADSGREIWHLQWPLVLGLALTWGLVFLIIHRGVRRVGRIVLITVPLPVVLLLILAVRGITLEGAGDGIEYYLKPDFAKLSDPQVWLAAYGQIFFSLSLGFGIMIAYASYNRRRGDITNNAFITSLANCATSFFAGFAVFSVLGFLAFKEGKPVEDVVQAGSGLAFVTYPTAISKLRELGDFWPPFVAILFFLTLLSLGIDSLFSLVEAAVAGLHDKFPWLSRNLLTTGMCVAGFLSGLLFVTRGGGAWIDVFNRWCNDYGLAFVGLMECLAIGYFFRTGRLRAFINSVSEIHLGGWWELCIRLVTPLVLIVLLGHQILTRELTGAARDWRLIVAMVVFAGVLVGAFALGRRWWQIVIVALGAAAFGVLRIWLSTEAALTGALAVTILFGGLAICIAIALRGKDVEHHEQAHGWPERERLEHLTAAEDAQDE
jgi:NSS family neurotransmitter:Na+ symporter